MNRLIPFTIFSVLLISTLANAMQISGAITSDTTWSGTVVADSVFVPVGRILTLQPGTTVKFNPGKMLAVAGKIIASGTPDSLITFTVNTGIPAPGDWKGIELQNSVLVSSVMNYCVIEYAGAGPNSGSIFYKTGAAAVGITNSIIRYSSSHGINVRSSSPRIANTIVRQNAGYGIFADLSLTFSVDSCSVAGNTTGGVLIGVNSTASILNSTIDSNGTGIFISNSAAPIITRNNIRYNSIGIQFTGVGATQPTITQDTIVHNSTWGFLNTNTSATVIARKNYWGDDSGPFNPSSNPTGLGDNVSNFVDFQPWIILVPNLPYIAVTGNITKDSTWPSGIFWVKNSIAVNTGFRLTIKPGVIVKFANSARLTVNGSITANGTPDSLIIFTSEKDDSYGGDTNGDSTTTLATRGLWDMLYLYFNQNSTSIVNNCVFKWGGSSSNGNLRVDGATPAISNIFSTQSSNYGLYLNNGANSTVSNSIFGSNNSYGILLSSSNANIYGSTVTSNGSYGINANGNSRFTVRKTTVTGNTYGIVADGGTSSATLLSLDSSTISFNTTAGMYLWYGTGPQNISYNRIEGNGTGYGIWCFNVDNVVTIDSNIILNHGQEGIITSKAVITNNLIQGNSYPITLIGRVNSTYSGNTIIGNLYDKALGLRSNRSQESLQDTLSTIFPAGITSKTYVYIDNSSNVAVSSGTTLVIQPGAVIKIAAGQYFRVDGTLIANGTAVNPIVFTSYRDAFYGGKTNLLSDNIPPAPNDWQYVRLYTNSTNNSLLNYCIFKYGGQGGTGNLYLSNNVVLTNPITNIISRKSGSMGIYISDCQLTFDNAVLDSNASYGMYMSGNRPSDITVRNSTIQDNNNTGLQAVNTSAFREVSNCFIRRNNGWGIGTDNGTLDQVYQGNTISFNASGGVYTNSPPILVANLRFVGNTITDHSGEGILSSCATFIDNTIQRNRFPLAVWRKTGNVYTDPSGADGNIISNNLYNAIAIWDLNISDTLKAAFPLAISSKTYVAIYDFEVSSGTTLVIEPGVTIKFQQIPANNWQQFNVKGTLIANGTPAKPIIFTSWRDSLAGGKTTSLTDFAPPAPGDWNYIAFRDGSGASVVRYCQFKYGGRDGQQTVYFETNVGSIVFSNNIVRRSSSSGIYVNNTPVLIDSTIVDSCASSGIRLSTNGSVNNLSLRYSKISRNGSYGIWAQNPSKVSVSLNNEISYNALTGLYVENNTIPLSVFGNAIMNNGDHGLYVVARNDAVDTLLMIAGNAVRNNGNTGIFTSRAYVIDDSITGNRYALGVVGQLSLAGTGTENGNFYQNNIITANKYNDVLVTQETIFGELGTSLPPAYSKVISVRGDLYVPTSTTLRIASGSILKFSKEYGTGYFLVEGTILAEGTLNNKIAFTSWKDDTYGGDTNQDTAKALPIPGDWNRIQLNGAVTNASRFFQCIVRYGGDVNGNGMLDFDQTTAVVESSFVSYARNRGIYTTNSASRIFGSEIHDNETGVFVAGSTVPSISNNNIYKNSLYGMYSSSTGTTTDADSNYWGSNLGPLVNQGADQNLAGTGNQIYISGSGSVNYRPFLFTRSGILPGDVSGNGQIAAYDASLVLQHDVGIITLNPIQKIAANVSGDTTISALDASYILRYVVGLISGFPGLGKQSIETDAQTAFSFAIEKSVKEGEFDLIIKLNKPVNVYAASFGLQFDTALVRPVSMARGTASDSMSLAQYIPSGKANVALAGVYPLSTPGDIARFTFAVSDEGKAKESILFTVTKFILNEMDVTKDGGTITLNVKDVMKVPTVFALDQNYPNPFNPTTTINYQLPHESAVSITVYNILGQRVHTLVNEHMSAGFYTLQWNGTDDNGQGVSSGMYMYRIEVVASDKQKFVSTKKMMFVK